MASHGGVVLQRATASTSNSAANVNDQPPVPPEESKTSTWKKRYDTIRPEFKFVCPFNIPSTPEAAAIRIIKNLNHLALYYAHFVWIILLITLIPQRKVSLVYLVIMTYVASLYLLLLRAIPKSWEIVHAVFPKTVVLGLIVLATMVELIVTDAGLHLAFTLMGSVPVVLVHAVLWVMVVDDGDQEEEEEVVGEFVPLASTAAVV